MESTLTVRDLLLPAEPLDSARVLAAEGRLGNPVTWVVSLRPYPPAFPRLRGGELALAAAEYVARLDPPTTLADVVRQLLSRDAAGLAVRGEVDAAAIELAEEGGLPLLRLEDDAPLHDIEQAIMRACALFQARREILPPEEPGAWLHDLFSGRTGTPAEAQSLARRHGLKASSCAVAFVPPPRDPSSVAHANLEALQARLGAGGKAAGSPVPAQPWEGGLVVLLPGGAAGPLLAALDGSGLACGIGGEKPLHDAPLSLQEAQAAALASALLCGSTPVRYSQMGADRLLILMRDDRPDELRAFVHQTLGPLLEHDQGAATPLLPTLEAFVTHGARLRETAAALYVHRNTLAYRLERAEELLNIDLKEPRARLAIELALRALPLVLPN